MKPTPADAVTWTAREVGAALHKRWPDSEYLHIDEAPIGSSRDGRKLDRLIFSLWSSRGHQRDGVEIKVSVSDFRAELKQGDKADWWYRHVHRFWIAAPAQIAAKIKDEIPPTWGLLAVSPTGVRVVIKAPPHDAEDIPAGTYLGLMRAAANAGPGALARARDEGYREGAKHKPTPTEQRSYVERKLVDLIETVRKFESASGVKIESPWNAPKIGTAVAIIAKVGPDRLLPMIENASANLRNTAEQSDAIAQALREVITLPTTQEPAA